MTTDTSNFDVVIRGGTIIDGSGDPPYVADIGLRGDLIAAIDGDLGPGATEIDARGYLVTPGFVDIHAHYDGQAIWAERLTPSSAHGVTTVVIGNCGVGFAPCRAVDRDRLVELMEGVEDIPGIVMTEGLTWAWESYPEFLDQVAQRPHDINIASYLPHAPLRVYVMGGRAGAGEPATPADVAEMARLTEQAMQAGAIGFSTSRFMLHRSKNGDFIPTLDAAEAELQAIADAVGAAGDRVLQINDDFKGYAEIASGFAMLRRIVERSGASLTIPVTQNAKQPDAWKTIINEIEAASTSGLSVSAQIMPRGLGMILGLETSAHPFALCPSYIAIADLPLADRVAAMREPALRERLLTEIPVDPAAPLYGFSRQYENLYELGTPPNYEPKPEQSVANRAAALGVSPTELVYDLLLEQDGAALLYLPFTNYIGGNLDAVVDLIQHDRVVMGLGDGGAHYGLICDASYPTFVLTHLVRDRPTGERLALVEAIKAMTSDTALHMHLADRGLLKPGYRADLNVIDHEHLTLLPPSIQYDLPAGGRRIEQASTGFVATIVNGTVVVRDDQFTGALPGTLVRGPQAKPDVGDRRS